MPSFRGAANPALFAIPVVLRAVVAIGIRRSFPSSHEATASVAIHGSVAQERLNRHGIGRATVRTCDVAFFD